MERIRLSPLHCFVLKGLEKTLGTVVVVVEPSGDKITILSCIVASLFNIATPLIL